MGSNTNRLPRGGRIDRTKPLRFTFDGRILEGYEGDTLSSALLAAGVSLVARSFKYHRPRGIYSAGVEEPNALVSLGSGGRHEPNCRTTTTALFDGLAAKSQNCWPSLEFDFLAVNNLLSPIFSAGFYYKTFMGPVSKAWVFYEHFIRRAAGMGSSSQDADPDIYEKANDFCDLLVIGAGSTGMSCALAAAQQGARVILVEQQSDFGGSLLDEPVDSASDTWRIKKVAQLAAHPNIKVLLRTTAFGAYDHGIYGLLQQVNDHSCNASELLPRMRYWKIRTRRTILAAGMIERPIVFTNNDLPGIMLASAVRSYINRYGVLPGMRAAIFTNNDTAYETALSLASAGSKVSILDARQRVPDYCIAMVRQLDIEVKSGCRIDKAQGGKKVSRIIFKSNERSHTTERLEIDLLCLSGGWAPTLHLWSQRGGKPVYDKHSCCFLPQGIVDGSECIGASAGRFSTADAVVDAIEKGFQVAREIIRDPSDDDLSILKDSDLPNRLTDRWPGTIQPLWSSQTARHEIRSKAFVDLQHDVTESDIQLAHREGYSSVEHLKRYTTQGMAADQGKTSNINALALMAKQRDQPIQEVGTTTFRPPYTPVPIGAFAGREQGVHFEPTRLSPMHNWHLQNNAEQIEAGLWLRAWYYPQAKESLDQCYQREAAHVRAKVGLVDISSLGKILIQGPNAVEFLERVYTNNWQGLKVGRVRYGIMLRDDGIILDDGTTARLAEDEFFMTTTTANAAAVMSHMEFLLQTRWNDLKVRLTSVTDQWAGMALAGPSSRKVLQQAATDCDVDNEALPHMGLIYAKIDGFAVRIHRMSFSGELAFEIFTHAGFGHSVWEAVLAAGKLYEIQPYGTEALAALRIEKGHVAGPELDGRTTLFDLGLEGLAGNKKSFVGKVLKNRPALVASDRPTLVGLETLTNQNRIKSGSILFGCLAKKQGHGEGHVTSTTYSGHLGKNIALALLKSGRQRFGETIVCSNPIEDQEIEVRVVSPYFYDPKGERLHG